MERKLILYALPLFALAILLDFFLDVLKKTNRYRLTDAITSVTIGYLGTTTGLLTLGFVGFFYNSSFRSIHIFEIDNSVLSWVLATIVYDFFYYWMHRAHHRINILWASHATHHNSEYFNYSTALRQSALGFFTVWIFFVPMAFAGFTYEQYLFGAGLSTLYGFFTHTECVRFIPYLEYIFIGPSSHRVHHGINASYLDRNYGSILSIWDHIFGTYAFEKVEDPVRFGTVPLLNSFNPFWANLTVYWLILKDAIYCNYWSDKFLVWVSKTGWRPDDFCGSWVTADGEKQVKDRTRFDPQINSKELFYVLWNFGIVTIATIHLTLTAKLHSITWSLLYIFVLWMLMLSNSFFLENKVFRFRFELVRLIITVGGGILFT